MPFPNFHAARVKDPGQYDKFATKSIAPGITAVLGIKGDKSEIQSYRFDKSKFSAQEAKAWLKAHDISPIAFEEAKGDEKDNSAKNPHEFLEYRAPFPDNLKMEDLPDGGLLVRDVPILAYGTWKDSNYGTPVHYSKELLERDHKSILDNGLWARHTQGVPRSIDDRVGDTQSDRYGDDAIRADLLLWGGTQKSKDAIWMVKNKKVNYVSAEVMTLDEKWDDKQGAYLPGSIIRGGTALVFKGACSKCKINNEAPEWDLTIKCAEEPGTGTEAESVNETEKESMEAKELEAKLEQTVKELSAERDASKKAVAELEALKKDYASTQASLKELGERVEKLARAPNPTTDAVPQERELEAPKDDGVVVDRAGKSVYRRRF